MKKFILTISGERKISDIVDIISSNNSILDYIWCIHHKTLYSHGHYHFVLFCNDNVIIEQVSTLLDVSRVNICIERSCGFDIIKYFNHLR